MPGMSWLYGDSRREYCDVCGETVAPVSWVAGRHSVMDCEPQRYATWAESSRPSFRPWTPVRSTFEALTSMTQAADADGLYDEGTGFVETR